ncbi:MAG: sodium ion-translocating decarboxylase subunit beta [Planctomycetes bacterium]|nr:sodium ion-translocating decarboxylase subunit beta [Planctomycetota bacterium]
MFESALTSLISGIQNIGFGQIVMILVGGGLIYLAVRHKIEPLLLVPIGFGAVLVNLPLSPLVGSSHGLLQIIYDFGVANELFPCLIFIGVGAMCDFGPLLENPKLLLLGAAGQFGIFLTIILALVLGFGIKESCSIGIIGACDGPTSIYVSSKYAPLLLPAISVAAYSYMSLVPIIQPPLMRAFTTQKERTVRMAAVKKSVSYPVRVLFPLVVTVFTCIIAPMGAPLIGTLMLGNFLKESLVAERLSRAAQNELANVVTLLLGISIGASMVAETFLKGETLIIFGLGLAAISLDTVCGIVLGKIMYRLSGGKVNPLIGAAGISAFPMSARVVQREGQKADPQNFLLMHAVGVNVGGQIASIVAASIMLSILGGVRFPVFT